MISTVYHLSIGLYAAAVRAIGAVNAKARARGEGARTALLRLPETPAGRDCYWMHCASVGEYEQGRPVWEALRAARPEARFVLSFFSPSGYEHFADREGHGEVVYLPWDRGGAPAEFVRRLSPAPEARLRLAIFVKYEWWFGYYRALEAAAVPTVLISASVRPRHLLLRPTVPPAWSPYRRALLSLDRVFAQDEASAKVLRINGGDDRVEVAGDTRVDRTLSVTALPLDEPRLRAWARRRALVLVAGSTWPPDEDLLARALARSPSWSVLVAPHEVDPAALAAARRRFAEWGVRFASRLDDSFDGRVVVVDSIGLLSRLYRLGQAAYVGGGFGAGIHNVLEPAAYGLAVAFGPRHARFPEAARLIAAGVARAVGRADGLVTFVDELAAAAERGRVLARAEAYFRTHAGATEAIVTYLRERGYLDGEA